jgi:hypothetical protein
MITRRSLIFLVLSAALPVAARAADPSAKAFVDSIYNAYKGKDAKGISLSNAAAVRRYFEPKLAAMILQDQKDAARHGEVGALDGDPFVNAQDWEIKSFDVAMHDESAGKAGATVSFRNLDVKTTVELDLVRTGAGWRITEITWDGDKTLRGLFGKQ